MSVDLSGQQLAHYLLREVIGRGGMSVVYRAVDTRLDRPVALKVMSENLSADAEFRARFQEEARAASALDHVNVVPLYDFGEAEGWLYIAMRLVDGTDLARELAGGPLPVRRVLTLLGQVGAALDMLHERGLVHLDVKPANVLITRNESVGTEHVYLADFGLTRRDATGHRTEGGDFLGSPSYASPEHLRGLAVLPSADEYSLTCMLFTALAGRAPYIGDVKAVITGHLSGQVPSLSALTGLPPAIDRVIARGMATEPSARYGSSSDLLSAARKAISQGVEPPPDRAPPVEAVSPPPGPPPSGLPLPGPPPTGQSSGPQPFGIQPPFGVQSAGAPSPSGAQRPTDRTGQGPAPLGTGSGQSGATQVGRAMSPPQAFAPSSGRYQPGPPDYSGPPSGPPGSRSPYRDPPTVGRPTGLGGDGARPTKHRADHRRAWWPWLAGAGVLVAAGVAALIIALSGSSTPSPAPQTPVEPGTSTSRAPATTGSAEAPNTLIVPTRGLPSGLSFVSGLPNPFPTTR